MGQTSVSRNSWEVRAWAASVLLVWIWKVWPDQNPNVLSAIGRLATALGDADFELKFHTARKAPDQ